MIWCHEFTWSNQKTGSVDVTSSSFLSEAEEIKCDSDHYISGINVKLETHGVSYAYLKLGATFDARTYWEHSDGWNMPDLDNSNARYHNDCEDADGNGDTDEYVEFSWPGGNFYEISKLWIQKQCCEYDEPILRYRIEYVDYTNTWVWYNGNSGWTSTGISVGTSKDTIEPFALTPFISRHVRIHIQSGDEHVGGRFDLDARKYFPSINQIKIQCLSRTGAGTHEKSTSEKTGTWQTMTTGPSPFVSSVKVTKALSYDSLNLGFYGMQLNFKDTSCKHELVKAASPSDISLTINVGDDDDTTYDQTLRSYSIFPDYLINTNIYRCPHSECKLLLNCVTLISTSPDPFEQRLIASNDTFQVNTDPIWEFDRSICVQCRNKYGSVDSLSFKTTLTLANDIVIW